MEVASFRRGGGGRKRRAFLAHIGEMCIFAPKKWTNTSEVNFVFGKKVYFFLASTYFLFTFAKRNLAEDKEGRDVFLAESPYALQMAMEKYPDIEFHFTSEF